MRCPVMESSLLVGNSNDPRAGAFAEHVVAVGDLQFRIPDDMSFEEAAAIGTAINTATQALYQHLNLPLPDQQASNDNIILVYGGATAIGTMAIQFAKLLVTYRPWGTCSLLS